MFFVFCDDCDGSGFVCAHCYEKEDYCDCFYDEFGIPRETDLEEVSVFCDTCNGTGETCADCDSASDDCECYTEEEDE